MTDLRKAAEMALEFVDWLCGDDHSVKPKNKALDVREALRKALAAPEQEHVAWVYNGILHEFDPSEFATSEVKPLYAAPPKREWVGLTDADKQEACIHMQKAKGGFWEFADYLDAKLKEKNHG